MLRGSKFPFLELVGMTWGHSARRYTGNYTGLLHEKHKYDRKKDADMIPGATAALLWQEASALFWKGLPC